VKSECLRTAGMIQSRGLLTNHAPFADTEFHNHLSTDTGTQTLKPVYLNMGSCDYCYCLCEAVVLTLGGTSPHPASGKN
jgi:hypothetical protein